MKKLLLLVLIIFSLSFKVFSNEDKIWEFNKGLIVNFGNTIYFDLNSSKLDNQYFNARKVIEENADYLLYPEKVWGKANDMTLNWLKENAYFLLIGGTWQELEDEDEIGLLEPAIYSIIAHDDEDEDEDDIESLNNKCEKLEKEVEDLMKTADTIKDKEILEVKKKRIERIKVKNDKNRAKFS